MNVVPFRDAELDRSQWRSAELEKLVQTFNAAVDEGNAAGWEVGMTELGDPQLYLLGPGPEYDCILCVSRVGQQYVLEDGHGQILGEHNSLRTIGERAWAAVCGRKRSFAARITLVACAIGETFEEKLEALLEGPAELLTHLGPQLAALA
jgi:hypothetical protein